MNSSEFFFVSFLWQDEKNLSLIISFVHYFESFQFFLSNYNFIVAKHFEPLSHFAKKINGNWKP